MTKEANGSDRPADGVPQPQPTPPPAPAPANDGACRQLAGCPGDAAGGCLSATPGSPAVRGLAMLLGFWRPDKTDLINSWAAGWSQANKQGLACETPSAMSDAQERHKQPLSAPSHVWLCGHYCMLLCSGNTSFCLKFILNLPIFGAHYTFLNIIFNWDITDIYIYNIMLQ